MIQNRRGHHSKEGGRRELSSFCMQLIQAINNHYKNPLPHKSSSIANLNNNNFHQFYLHNYFINVVVMEYLFTLNIKVYLFNNILYDLFPVVNWRTILHFSISPHNSISISFGSFYFLNRRGTDYAFIRILIKYETKTLTETEFWR